MAETSKETANSEVCTVIFQYFWLLVLVDILQMPVPNKGRSRFAGLQSQKGNRSPGLYQSKYGTLFSKFTTMHLSKVNCQQQDTLYSWCKQKQKYSVPEMIVRELRLAASQSPGSYRRGLECGYTVSSQIAKIAYKAHPNSSMVTIHFQITALPW